MTEYLRLYIALHGDHEGGNASAHTSRESSSLRLRNLVISCSRPRRFDALRPIHLVLCCFVRLGWTTPWVNRFIDPASVVLMGPHSLANQEVLRWQLEMQEKIGNDKITHETIKDYLWETLKSGRVVPGSVHFACLDILLDPVLTLGHRYGHGVLRSPDPRFIALQEFCDKRPELLASPTIQLVKQTYEVAPDVLTEHGKTKNPWPNVDAASGCVLYHYGLTQFKASCSGRSFSKSRLNASTVLYGYLWCLPRWVLTSIYLPWRIFSPLAALGCLSQLVWARGTPLTSNLRRGRSPESRFTFRSSRTPH